MAESLHQGAAAILRNQATIQKKRLRVSGRQNDRFSPNSPGAGLSGDWIQLGPSPLSSDASGVGLQDYNFVAGRATSVAIDASDPSGNTVYIGAAYGGVWKSTNAGPDSPDPETVTWTPLTDNQQTLAVGSIAIQPQLSNPDPTKSVILAGTGETDGSADSYYGLGILRSADAGATWSLITQAGSRSFAGLGFSKIAFSSQVPTLVVAAASAATMGITEDLENPINVSRGIYYSTNAGVSWNYATVKDGSTVIDPASVSSVVYNAAANTGTGEFFAAVALHGIYSSPDGINWSRLANQPGTALSSRCLPHTFSFSYRLSQCIAEKLPLSQAVMRCTCGMWTPTITTVESGRATMEGAPGRKSAIAGSLTAATYSEAAEPPRAHITSRWRLSPAAPQPIFTPGP